MTAYELLRGELPEAEELLVKTVKKRKNTAYHSTPIKIDDPAKIERVAMSIEDKVSYEFQGNKSLSFLFTGK